MKKTVVSLAALIALNMLDAVHAYALNLTENIVVPTRDLLMMLILQVILLFIGASVVKIERKTFGKAIWATLGIVVLCFLVLAITTSMELGIGIGAVITGILSVVVIQKIFETSFIKALEAFLFAVGANAAAVFVISFILHKFALQ